MKIEEFFLKYFHIHLRKAVPSQYGRIENRYTYQQRYVDFKIKPTDKVLDIGSGHDPLPLATHLADYYEGDTTHRSHEKLKKDNRPFENCSIEAMPYEDKFFDFVYSSHILEHVDSPAKACAELIRVGKRGYIETPTKMTDILLNHMHMKNHHRWHLNIVNNTLVFIEYTDQEKDYNTKFDHFYHDVHSPYQNTFQDMYYQNFPLFYNMYMWEDKFDYFVFDKTGQLIGSSQ